MAYTKDDLEKAEADLLKEQKRWDNYSGNNPNKYQASLRSLRSRVNIIHSELIRTGVVATPKSGPKSEKQLLDDVLDKSFPNARNREIVEHQGRRYQRLFWPIEKSNSGKTVHAWGREWKLVEW